MFFVKKYCGENWGLLVVLTFIVLITSLATPLIHAQTGAEVLSDILDYPTDVEVGETFTFYIRYRCASSTDDCGEIIIDASFPDLIDILNIDTGNADIDSEILEDDAIEDEADGLLPGLSIRLFTDLTGSNAILCDNSANDVCFTAGQTGIATITARVHTEGYYQTGGPDIPIVVDSTANDPVNGSSTNSTSDTTTITEPEARYEITKVRTDTPESAAEPIPGNNVTYQITITPTAQQDNLLLDNITISDYLPANSVFVSASDGGTESAGVVTWTGLSTTVDANDQIQPITVTVTVNYPTSDFSTDEDPQPGTATSVTNNVDFTADEAQTGVGACVGVCDTAANTHSFDPPTADPNVVKSIETNPVGIDGTGRYNLSLDNSFANIEISNATLTDVLPTDAGAEFGLPLELEAIEVGEREATILVSTLSTCSETSPDTDFTALSGSPFAASSTIDVTSHPTELAVGNQIKCVRWIWTDGTVAAGDGISGMQIRFTPRFTDTTPEDGVNDSGFSVPALGASYTNCMTLDFDGPDPADVTLTPPTIARSASDCDDVDIATSVDNVSLASSKSGDSEAIPDDTISFDINFNLTERSSQILDNPVIIEALPLEFDVSTLVATIVDVNDYLTSAEETAILASQTAPVVTTISGTDYNVIEWTLPDITPLEDEDITFSIHIEVDMYPYIQNGTYSNLAYFLSQNDTGDLICETGTLESDTENLDGDGTTLERCAVSSDYSVPATAILQGQKWIQNETNTQLQVDVINTPQEVCEDGYTVSRNAADGLDDLPPPDNLFSRYPCAADGIPSDSFTYSLTIRNIGNANIEDYTLIDILPYPGDTEVIPRSGSILLDRDSEWRPYLKPDGITLDDIDLTQDPLLASVPVASRPTIAGTPIDDNTDVTIEYSLSSNPCRSEVATVAGCDPAPATWSFVPATADDWKRVRAFKITANSGFVLRPADQIEITIEMEIPTDSPPDETGTPDDSLVPQAGDIIWNSYAHVGTNEVTGVDLLSAEPIKVGIRIPETVSVGNRVWFDANNSGDIDGSEVGLANVTISLYEWDGTNPTTLVDTTTTDASGYYIFNLIPDGIDPDGIYAAMGIPVYDPDQDYVIIVDDTNFNLGGTLQDYVNSTGSGSPNNEDDAGDVFVTGFGYVSSVFQLDPDQEDTADETEVNGTLPTTNDDPVANVDFGALGRGSLGQDDDNSDLRKDFGFFLPMSIGNRVWFDTGALTNNGIQEGDEAGVAGVTLSLYADADSDGVPDSTVPLATTTTDDDGYYLFDRLGEGIYLVGVDITNFDDSTDPLFGYEDSDLNDTTDTDENDNGQTDTFQLTFGELSGPISLTVGTEPTISTTEVDQTVPTLANGGDADYDQSGRDPDIPPDPDATRDEYGRYGALDINSNLTVDFGFWRPEMALGNFVWDDVDNDSQYDATENAIADVIVNLYRDLDEDGTPDDQNSDFVIDDLDIIATTSTDANGYYLFDALSAGGYIVELDPDNWRAAGDDAGTPEIEGVLIGYISSTRNDSIDGPTGTTPPFSFPDEWDDQFDDGRNRDSYADLSATGFTGTSYEVSGIRSETVTLDPESEAPGTENAGLPPNSDPDPTDGDTTEPHTDTNIGAANRDFNSDLTVDFGVFIPLSIGNRIWEDNYEDPGGTGERAGDGEFDSANESGIAGVEVWLYKLDDGGDATDVNDYTRVQVALDVNATTLTDVTDTTDASGYYLFDGLGEGTYRVRVIPDNFTTGVLQDFISSNGVNGVATTNTGDADDNFDSGIDATDRDPTTDGIWSDQVVLTRDSEPTVGADPLTDESGDVNPETNGSLATYDGPNGIGLFNEDDDNSDVTVDFGFFRPLSLGNRVWFDANGNGTDDTETGFDGVTVQLFQDDGTGTFVQVAEVETANGGYYRFDGLQPGDYQVHIPEVEFQAGGTLEQYISTLTLEPDPNSDGDLNDNGIDNNDPSNGGISSGTVTLSYDGEPTSDTDEPATYADGSVDPDTATAGEGAPGADNNDQNLSVDFGFVKPFSLGNRVWYDYDADGIMDIVGNDGDSDGYSGEVGVEGVTVNLYDATGTTLLSTVYTNAEGYYRFDNLLPGDYIVEIPASEFLLADDDDDGDTITDDPGELYQFASSVDALNGVGLDPDTNGTTASDVDDNGVDPATYGDLVRSQAVTLGPDVLDPTTVVEPDGDDDEPTPADVTGYGTNAIDPDDAIAVYDTRSNTTVDFGFFPYYSLGNRVWFDDNNDGILQDTEEGVPGVTVNLYFDSDRDGTVEIDTTESTPYSTVTTSTTTGEEGFYRFDMLPAGYYIVEVDAGNFTASGDPLFNYVSSFGFDETLVVADDNTNHDDDGRDLSDPVDPATDGVRSTQVTIGLDLAGLPEQAGSFEPIGEVLEDGSGDPDAQPGGYEAAAIDPDGVTEPEDRRENATVDFGFFRPMSIGNRVWIDLNGDGQWDASEPGIDGVTVNLLDGTGMPVLDNTGNPYTVETDQGGYYRFDGLPEGSYIVEIPTEEFQVDGDGVGDDGELLGYISTEITETDPNETAPGTDSDDNGLNVDDPSTDANGVRSGVIILSYDNEPTGETDEPAGTPPNYGTGVFIDSDVEPADEDSNLTIDFGFIRPFSLGNRVWLDYDADGIMDITGNDGDAADGYSAEVGIAGVSVNLYSVSGTVETLLSTVYTDADGYYRFDNLMPGDYLVEIPASEFLLADDDDDGDTITDDPGELYQFASSLDTLNGVGLDPDADSSDFDDNGVDPATYGDVVRSQVVTLGPDAVGAGPEPTTDGDEPTSYAAISIDPDAATAVADDHSDTTVDFGFFPYYSLGNRVWYDDDNDGVLDATEEGVPGVTVNLYFDSNRDGIVNISGTEGTPYSTVTTSTTTGEEGFYRFDLLPAGYYIVEVDASNFTASTDPLFGHVSSFGFNEAAAPGADGDVNHDDDGREVSSPATPEIDGVRSTQVTIGLDGSGLPEQINSFEPTGELLEGGVGTDAQPSGYEAAAIDPDGITEPEDRRENATVDFGFYRQISLGNRVWIDLNGNGLIDTGEPGVDGVTVNLLDGTGVPYTDYAGNPYTVVTDENGYYRFDGLLPGDYIVEIPTEEFQVDGDGLGDDGELLGYISTEITEADPDDVAPGTDSDDNGLNVDDPSTNADGVRSGVLTLDYTTEPTGETDDIADYDTGVFPVTDLGRAQDANENLTVDFGFVRPFSLGNRVWLDYDADGIMDITGNDGDAADGYSAEVGIEGVTVNLYNNVSPTVIVSTVQTDANGYYRFDNLMPGDYFVEIPASEFLLADDGDGIGTSGELYQLASSLDALNGVGLDPDADSSDFDDNGVDPTTYGDVVRSQVVTLGPDAVGAGPEPTTDGDEPTSYAAISIDPDAATAVADDHSDTTVDFGFFPYGSLGNYVWLDVNNNNTIDGGEVGIGGVTVNLYYDRDGDGTVDLTQTAAGQDGDVYATVTTSQTGVNGATEDGYYRFDLLPAGEYIVEIPNTNFVGTTDPLFGYTSSNSVAEDDPDTGGTAASDVDDNGVDPLASSTLPEPRVDGVLSDQVTLNIGTDTFPFGTAYNEPSGETQPTDYGTDAVEPDGITAPADDSGNLTVDFGFFQPLSIGNRVWYDDDAGGDIDATEIGISGVTVILRSASGTEIDRVETDTDGYYRFDNLIPGDYYIEIPATEFQGTEELVGYLSSPQPAADPDTDASDTDDNGISDPTTDDFATTGIRSEVVTLEAVSSEPTGEDEPADGGDADLMPDYGAGSFTGAQAVDDRANLTVDFGFFKPMSLGNRVWYDANADGDDLDGEDPVAGVTVELYRPGVGLDGVAGNADDANALYTVTTDSDGYYRFDNLAPGDYIVTIPGSNFNTGGVLENYISSAHFGTDPTVADPDDVAPGTDRDDNGINQATTADRIANGVSSGTVTLDAVIHSSAGNEPTGEIEPVSYGVSSTAPTTGISAEDARSNLTVDFGFYVPMAIGNRVFSDDGAGTGGVVNDGIQNGTEAGIDGVLVGLYTNNAGSPGTAISSTITQDGGYYLFDGLPEGEYIVVVEADNFIADGTNDALVDLFSSFFAPDGNDTDSGEDGNDNGINNDTPSTTGVQSTVITLVRNDEPSPTNPSDDTDIPASGTLANEGRNGELDENSDLTVDFGFPTPPMSIGNYVWYDLNNNGLVDAGENPVVPVGGLDVIVDLYRDDDQDGQPDDLNGDLQITNADRIATTTVDSNGFYLFDRLDTGAYLTQGYYIVGLNFINFRSGQILEDYYSSNPTEVDTDDEPTDPIAGIIDQNDNGIDRLNENVGIFSDTILLSPEDEPTSETPLSGNTAEHGPNSIGRDGQRDTNSNVTVDFGLYKPMSIGNRVWYDINDNGLIDTGTESGIANVQVTLLDGVGTPISTTTTDANGYYLFDNLTPGTYQIRIDPVNWTDGTGALDNLPSSSTDNVTNPSAANNTDSNDNGVNAADEADRETNGILSELIVLDIDSQPTSEGDRSNNPLDGPNYIGNNGETDNNSDITIDFGFVPPNMSLGNFVWYDYNNNGLYDSATEEPVENVNVSLFRADAGGNPTGTAIQTDTTDANGYYLFDSLTPGQYVVVVNSTNFASGNPLNGFLSSQTGVASAEANPDDTNDNGIDDSNPAANGIQSAMIDLVRDNAPTGETDLGPDGIGSADNDANSDLTIDFGFYQPMSIGNRVWFDTDDNGQIDATENGVGGVIVNLYDAGDLTTPITSTTTDSNGYYIFDNLIPGDYVVEIPASEFGDGEPLENTVSSSVETPDTDERDNGSNETDPTTTPTRSGTITLELNTEPTGEDEGPDGRGNNGETDSNSNLTVDFGFVPSDTYSIGNRVWIDENRDGVRVDTEAGVGSVALSLYLDADLDGEPDTTTPEATTTTNADGYYIFDGLTAGTYIVAIDPDNFTGTGPLVGYASTTPAVNAGNTPPDDDDNRAFPTLGETFDATYGITSESITLSSGDEPTSELDIDPTGTNSAPDSNSDLTIDFGFYQSLALGNRVWFDSNNDGIHDAGEPGIGNVTVTLYTYISGTGLGSVVDTDTTDGNGYYLFNNLPPGDYVVVVDDTNFDTAGALSGFTSSPDGDPTGDRNDNGIDDPDPLNNGGILSDVITLDYNSTPTGETDTSGNADDGPNFRGINNESDDNSGLTVDFGFFASTMSIGNYVWLDDGAGGGTANNGVIDGSEEGIAGVELELYPANVSGTINGSVIDTTTTDAEGYYIFDNVPPGNYIIVVTSDNFDSGNPLENLYSSDGSDGGTDDKDDNGIDDLNPETNGIQSELIVLQSNNAPTTEIADNISSDTTAYGPNGTGLSDPSDDNSDLTIDFGFTATYDWGDAPDGTTFNSGTVTGDYGTVSGTGGANHRIISTLHLGQIVDDETGNLENDSATADDNDPASDDDEDGVVIPPLVAGTTVNIEVTVFNNTGEDAYLIGWIDWNLDGNFDPEEAIPNQLPSGDTSGLVVEFDSPIVIPSSASEQVVQIPVFVPLNSNAEDTDLTDGNDIYTFARFRLTTDALTENDPTGSASDGEVEDYRVQVQPPGLSIVKTDSLNSVVVGESTTYTITVSNSGVDVFDENIFDQIPTSDPNGFDPDSIEWTCEANEFASCIAGDALGTDIDTIQTTATIDQDIDILGGGVVVFTITASVRDNHVAATISNTATLESGPESTDEDGVIYDPPSGVKSGVLNGSTITWTMTWINTGGPQTATITDPIRSDQTFAGNLDCNAFGTSTTTTCNFSGGNVTWEGTIGTGNANRIEISFDVTVSGSPPYRNIATIDLGGDTATAAASVGSSNDDDDDDDGDPGNDGGYVNSAPLLTKTVDTPFTLPGATVVWTINATNNTNATVTTVSITDPVPSELTITDVQSSSGDVNVNGQQVTLNQGSLAPGETITITITTDVGDDVAVPFAINNPALLTCDCTESRNAVATIVSVLELPATGETPWWHSIGILIGLSGIGAGGLLVYRRKHLLQ